MISPLGYERVYLPLCEVADMPLHIQDSELLLWNIITRLKSALFYAYRK